MSPTILAALISAGAAIAVAVLSFLVQARRQQKEARRSRRFEIKRVTDPSDPDVAIALELYEDRIPPEERDSSEDIVRWLEEVRRETREGKCQLTDFFLVAKVEDELVGFAYVQYYPRFSLGYFCYLVVKDKVPESKGSLLSLALLETANRLLRKADKACSGIVVEVDEPRTLKGKRKNRADARIKLFRRLSRQLHFHLKSVSVPYFQPRLSFEPDAEEYPLRLMYAVYNPKREPSRLTKQEVVQILTFLSDAIYGDQFEHRVDWDQQYRAYLNSWRERLASQVPNIVELV